MTEVAMEHRLLTLIRRAAGDVRSDAELLARLDDHAAFAELVARHGPMVWGVCRHLLGEADAEDAFQATFLALLRNAIRDRAAVASWLHGVAVRVSLSARREAGRRRVRERAVAVPEAARPRQPYDWDDTMVAVHREVALLPDADREAFVLCVLESRTQGEAAARLGRTAGAVAGQVARAKKRLVERLSGRGILPALAAVGTGSVAGAISPQLMARALGLPGVASPTVIRLAKGALGVTTSSTRVIGAAVAAVALAIGGLAAYPDGPRVPPTSSGSPSGPKSVRPEGRPAAPPGNGAAEVESKLHGFWNGGGACQGDITFRADGTYSWIDLGPGSATVAGTWSMRWDALPPTLVMTSTASNEKEFIGVTKEVKVLRLDEKVLLYEQNAGKWEFTREPRRVQKQHEDVSLIQGRWKVLKDEYRDGTNWVEADAPRDFTFDFSADSVTIAREKTSLRFRLTLKPDEKVMNLVRAAGKINKLECGVYRLQENRHLTICVVGGHLLPADEASKAATLRLYHLKRVDEPKK
jgi:RNA polymerase sigma factor (sigma-70 family)